MATAIGEISTGEYARMVREVAYAMAEADGYRFWKIEDDNEMRLAQKKYEGMAKRHLAAQRVLWNWSHK